MSTAPLTQSKAPEITTLSPSYTASTSAAASASNPLSINIPQTGSQYSPSQARATPDASVPRTTENKELTLVIPSTQTLQPTVQVSQGVPLTKTDPSISSKPPLGLSASTSASANNTPLGIPLASPSPALSISVGGLENGLSNGNEDDFFDESASRNDWSPQEPIMSRFDGGLSGLSSRQNSLGPQTNGLSLAPKRGGANGGDFDDAASTATTRLLEGFSGDPNQYSDVDSEAFGHTSKQRVPPSSSLRGYGASGSLSTSPERGVPSGSVGRPPLYPSTPSYGIGYGGTAGSSGLGNLGLGSSGLGTTLGTSSLGGSRGLAGQTPLGGASLLSNPTPSTPESGFLHAHRNSSASQMDDDLNFDLESTVAQKITEQYKEILANKPVQARRYQPSEVESVKTEDFANKFNLTAAHLGGPYVQAQAPRFINNPSTITEASTARLIAAGDLVGASGSANKFNLFNNFQTPSSPVPKGPPTSSSFTNVTGLTGGYKPLSPTPPPQPTQSKYTPQIASPTAGTLGLGLGSSVYVPRSHSNTPPAGFTSPGLGGKLSLTSGKNDALGGYPVLTSNAYGSGRMLSPEPFMRKSVDTRALPQPPTIEQLKAGYTTVPRMKPDSTRLRDQDSEMTSTPYMPLSSTLGVLQNGPPPPAQFANGPSVPTPPPAPSPSLGVADASVKSRDIKRESERIRNELELERRKKQAQTQPSFQAAAPRVDIPNGFSASMPASPARQAQPLAQAPAKGFFGAGAFAEPTPRQQLETRLTELEELNREVKHLRNEREGINDEIEKLKELMKQQQKNQQKFTQQRREEASREIDALNGQMQRKKAKLDELEELMKRRVKELRELESLGLTKSDIEAVIAERNELLEMIKSLEEQQMQRYELEKQLQETKEVRANEQRKFQAKVDNIEEELKVANVRLNEAQRDADMLKSQIKQRDDQINSLEIERGKLMQASTQAVEGFSTQMQQELSNVQQKNAMESARLRAQQIEIEEKLNLQVKELEWKNQIIAQLSDDKKRLQDAIQEERQDLEERKKITENLKEDEVRRVYEMVQKEKEEAVRGLHQQLEQEHSQILDELQAKLTEQIEQREEIIKEKERELLVCKDKIRYLEASLDQLKAKVSAEMKDEVVQQIKNHVDHERKRWEIEHEDALLQLHNEVVKQKLEKERALAKISEQLTGAAKGLDERDNEIRALRQELEQEREGFKKAAQDRQNQLAKAKEEAKQLLQGELAKQADEFRKEHERDQSKIREQSNRLKENGDAQNAKLAAAAEREKELVSLISKLSRSVAHELNEECRHTAGLLGVSPKLVDVSSFKQNGGPEQLADNKQMVTTAIATMRAVSQQLRDQLREVSKELEAEKVKLAHGEEAKMADIEKLKADMQLVRQKELDDLRDRLTKNYSEEIGKMGRVQASRMEGMLREKEEELTRMKANLDKWKEETAQRIAAAMHDEFKAEWEKKMKEMRDKIGEKDMEVNNLKREIERMKLRSPKQQEDSAAKVITQLQEHLKQVREENLQLHRELSSKRISSSTNDLVTASLGLKPTRSGSIERLATQSSMPDGLQEQASPLASSNDLRDKQLAALEKDYNLLRSKLHPTSTSSGVASGAGSRGSSSSGGRLSKLDQSGARPSSVPVSAPSLLAPGSKPVSEHSSLVGTGSSGLRTPTTLNATLPMASSVLRPSPTPPTHSYNGTGQGPVSVPSLSIPFVTPRTRDSNTGASGRTSSPSSRLAKLLKHETSI